MISLIQVHYSFCFSLLVMLMAYFDQIAGLDMLQIQTNIQVNGNDPMVIPVLSGMFG